MFCHISSFDGASGSRKPYCACSASHSSRTPSAAGDAGSRKRCVSTVATSVPFGAQRRGGHEVDGAALRVLADVRAAERRRVRELRQFSATRS